MLNPLDNGIHKEFSLNCIKINFENKNLKKGINILIKNTIKTVRKDLLINYSSYILRNGNKLLVLTVCNIKM